MVFALLMRNSGESEELTSLKALDLAAVDLFLGQDPRYASSSNPRKRGCAAS